LFEVAVGEKKAEKSEKKHEKKAAEKTREGGAGLFFWPWGNLPHFFRHAAC
jgi:hypothetical protein